MKLVELVACYKALGEAKVTKLEESEVIKVVKARKAMRPFAEEYDAFLKDVQEKFKPENFDEIQSNVQKWKDLSDEEKIATNKTLAEYQKKVNDAVEAELNKVVEVSVEKLNENSATKILLENGWELKKLDEIEVVL